MNKPANSFASRMRWWGGGGLLLAAAWIWLRERSWIDLSADTLAVLIVLPLAWFLASPVARNDSASLPTQTIAARGALLLAVVLLPLGVVTGITLALAIAWTLSTLVWLDCGFVAKGVSFRRLAFLLPWAFPWLTLDADFIGWWFRLSGAWVTELLFSLAGFEVIREGSFVLVQQMPVSIEAACSGLNLLQSLMIGGTFLVLFLIRGRLALVVLILALPLVAWVANTARILLITAVGLTFSVETASGLFHMWGAFCVILLMMLLTWGACLLVQRGEAVSGER